MGNGELSGLPESPSLEHDSGSRGHRRVSVSEQIARCGVPRKGLGDLLREPNLRRVSGDLEMDDSPSMVIKYNHGIKHPKRRGRDDNHVDRDDACHMVP